MIKRLILICSTLLLSACSVFSPVQVQPVNRYVLNTLPATIHHYPTHPITLYVAQPEVRPIYHTQQMAYTTHPYQISYFVKNQWAETPGQMFKILLVQGLQQTHYFRAVVLTPYDHQYSLITRILQIQQNLIHQPKVEMIVEADLVKAATNQVIASRQFSVSYPMYEVSPYAGVIALNQANAKLLGDIIQFCVEHV